MKKSIAPISLSLVALMAFSACETSGDNALAGAAVGAAIGGLATGRGRGALHGAAIGAASGYVLGKLVNRARRDREDRYYRERADERRDYEDPRDRYPYANPTDRYGFVTSPYRPYHLIDVRGVPHGAQVIDPSCDRIFINP